jgi:hypothetical protein
MDCAARLWDLALFYPPNCRRKLLESALLAFVSHDTVSTTCEGEELAVER